MTEQTPNYSPLSPEQLTELNDAQKDIFQQLDEKDRQFFAKNFSPASLGKALERKWETIQSRARLSAFDQRVKENLTGPGKDAPEKPGLNAGDLALGAAGVAGVVGIGVLASKIAPEGKATWRGVTPRDLIDPLVKTFARQEKTDIRFEPPTAEGLLQASVLLRTSSGMLPGLTVVLTPLKEATEVQISKVSSDSILGTVKEGGQKLIDLVQDGLRLGKKQSGAENLLDLAGKMVNQGVDIAQSVKDLNLEDKAWEAIQNVAAPLQAIYNEKMAEQQESRLKLEMAWDDYISCPKCRVNFGADDLECRVCGTARPPRPEQPDPRDP
ncbi:MAG: hypothetical protein AB1894_06260 [Chloroflexota bacterium]